MHHMADRRAYRCSARLPIEDVAIVNAGESYRRMPPKLYRKAPAECSPAERAEFAALVCKGGEVNSKGFDARISLAAQLVFLKGDTNLLGIAAIKNPLSGYRIFVSKNAGRRSVQLSFRLSLAGSLLRRTPEAKAIRMHW